MPAGNLESRINFQITAQNKASKVMGTVSKSIKSMTDAVNASSHEMAKQQGIVKKAGIDAKKTMMSQFVPAVETSTRAVDRMRKGWNEFFTNFQPGFLSVMFGGMQLQRVMGSLIRGMIANFKELAIETDPTRIALTRLEGSIKFLKFQIVQAAGPLIQQFAGWLADLANTVAKSDPEKLKMLAISIGALWTLGFGLFTIGQLGTFVTGMGNLIANLAGASAAQAASTSGTLAANLGKMAGIGAIGVGLGFLFEGISDAQEGKITSGILGSLGGIATGLGGVLLLKGKTGLGMTSIAVGILFKALADERGFQNVIDKTRGVLAEIGGLGRASIVGLYDAVNADQLFGDEIETDFFQNYAIGRENVKKNTDSWREWASEMDMAKFRTDAAKVSYDDLNISLADSSSVAQEYYETTGLLVEETDEFIRVAPNQVEVLYQIAGAYNAAAEAKRAYSEADEGGISSGEVNPKATI